MSVSYTDLMSRRARLDPENDLARKRAQYEQARITGKKVEEEVTQAITPSEILSYVFSGRSIFTVKSLKTNKYVTFKFQQKVDKKKGTRKVLKRYDFFYVSVREGNSIYTGSFGDSRHNFKYVGCCTEKDKNVFITKNSLFNRDDPVFSIINFVLNTPTNKYLRVYHNSSCGRCGLMLTVPESVKTGIGPVCAGRIQEEKRAAIRG